MKHSNFKKLIKGGSDIDHETALKMIDAMWPHFDKCAKLMKKDCIDDGEEILNDMFIADAEKAEEIENLAKNARWCKKTTGKLQIIEDGEIIAEQG